MNSSVMGYSCLSSSSAYSNPSKFPTLRIFHGPNFSSSSSLSFMSFPQNPRPPISTHHLPPNPPPLPPFNGRFKIHHRTTSILRQPLPNRKFSIRASIKEGLESSSNTTLIIVSSVITVILAVANRVLYKLALVPMKDYPFFLAQLTTFGYVAIYFSILYVRYRAGIVTDEMMAIPKSPFIVIGILEALGVAAGMSSGVTCLRPGSVESSLRTHGMTFLVWQLAFSVLLLGRKYSWNRIAGCLLVAAGVVVAVASGSDTGQMLSGIGFVWPVLMIVSSAFQAGASILKESVFIDAANRLKGKLLDIFVVNSFGSGFQALFVFLFLPFLSSLKGIPFSLLPTYIKSGAGCFFNIGAHTLGCEGAPLLPLLYMVTNIAFNISALHLLKISSAVVSSLNSMSSVPISIYILSLPLPYLPEGVSLSPFFLIGSMILVVGLILYNIPQPLKLDSEIE
ncbi:protein CLT2, chloroplastic-like isoform X1 [Camellia sinensis]|uniref:protein CLT2, chloroplastic-like isoform X1 n=1 Tax=Camellia sinensis TaxID=4442 RepID=UPI001035F390|nr:protein CLT2, chloroplastic-like isoform X1 [Camellia sinensis]